ncbi:MULTISPECIES: NUDIX domain-containing protein [Sphingomonas]|uniref:NUDIX domain-containing protein n=1 Tax=Sphingomonas TaxID=13687 RepID=UPI000DEED3D1|nr:MULTISPECIES: NUDIX domain-containing protein [Sphingomonas]
MADARPRRGPHSAGVLLYRIGPPLEVLLVKPGGPYWRHKDIGAWMIPKGMIEAGESPLDAAVREFGEETGMIIGAPPWPLSTVRQAGGKLVEAFAAEGEFDPAALTSIEFEMEWPPRSGQLERFPEVVEARWFDIAGAREAMLKSQLPLLDALVAALAG